MTVQSLTEAAAHQEDWIKKTLGTEGLSDSEIKISPETYEIMLSMNFPVEVERGVRGIVSRLYNFDIVANQNLLLEQAANGLTRKDLSTGEEKNLYNLEIILAIEEVWREIDVLAAERFPKNQVYQDVVADIARELIRPNLTLNMQETQDRREAARDSVMRD